MITLTVAATTITLPDDLRWVDETDWTPAEQTTEYSLAGALIVDGGLKQAGRPITLDSYDGDVWLSRSTVLALQALAAIPGLEMTLMLWGVTYTVIFSHEDGRPVEAAPVLPISPPADDDWYTLTLRLMEI